MAKSTEAELEGQPWGAVGTFGPVALQSGLNKLRKPDDYYSTSEAFSDLSDGEVSIVFVNGVPTVVAKDNDGQTYSSPFNGAAPTDLHTLADIGAWRRYEATSFSASGFPLTANVIWPDGNPGVMTGVEDPVWEGAFRSFTVTYGNPVQFTFTQPTMTRSSIDGRVTLKPIITVS